MQDICFSSAYFWLGRDGSRCHSVGGRSLKRTCVCIGLATAASLAVVAVARWWRCRRRRERVVHVGITAVDAAAAVVEIDAQCVLLYIKDLS